MDISIVILRFQDDCVYPLGFDDPIYSVKLRSVLWTQGAVLYVEVKLGNNIFCAA